MFLSPVKLSFAKGPFSFILLVPRWDASFVKLLDVLIFEAPVFLPVRTFSLPHKFPKKNGIALLPVSGR
jgi:hypothetical protein